MTRPSFGHPPASFHVHEAIEGRHLGGTQAPRRLASLLAPGAGAYRPVVAEILGTLASKTNLESFSDGISVAQISLLELLSST